MNFMRGSSSYARIGVHVTFKVKYCHKVFDYEPLRTRCEAIFREVAAEQRVFIDELGFDSDHVHMVLYISVTHRIDHLAKSFKGRSGKMLLREFPWIKKKFFWGSGLWGAQIYADSVGNNQEDVVSYVRNQRWSTS